MRATKNWIRTKMILEYIDRHLRMPLAEEKRRNEARIKLSNELAARRLWKNPCEHCGSCLDLEGHHVDYDRPLMLVWLCKKCHQEVHAWHRQQRWDEAAFMVDVFLWTPYSERLAA